MERRTYLRGLAAATAGTAATAGCAALDGGSGSANTTLARPDLDAEPQAYPYPQWSQPIPEVTLPAALAGGEVTTTALDRPFVLTFIFTHCRTACPVLTLALTKAQRAAIDGGWADEVTFAEVTFDPERDTAERFREYADERDIALDTGRWYFLRPSTVDRAKAVVEGTFGLAFQRTTPEEADADGYMFAHSTLVLLVNADGYVERAYRDGQQAAQLLPDHLAELR